MVRLRQHQPPYRIIQLDPHQLVAQYRAICAQYHRSFHRDTNIIGLLAWAEIPPPIGLGAILFRRDHTEVQHALTHPNPQQPSLQPPLPFT